MNWEKYLPFLLQRANFFDIYKESSHKESFYKPLSKRLIIQLCNGQKAWLQLTEKEINMAFKKMVQSHSWTKKCILKLQQDAVFHVPEWQI